MTKKMKIGIAITVAAITKRVMLNMATPPEFDNRPGRQVFI